MPEAGPGRAARAPRDPRLDTLRGAALVTIFLTHVPGNAFERFTLREWGFSDAAEGFVLMAGVSAGLAYGPAFRPGGDAWAGTARVWGRAWTIYLAHLLVVLAALAIASGLALWAGLPGLLDNPGLGDVLVRPLEVLAAIPLLLHLPDYADILPLYAVLLLAMPAVAWAGWRRPWALLAASVALWALSGTLRLNLPTWPEAGGWFFSPPSWQLLFVAGLLTGLAARDGRRLIPVRRDLVGLAAAIVLLAFLWRVVGPLEDALGGALARARDAGGPWVLLSFSKTWASAPRVVHALALAYLVSALPAVRRLCASRAARPLALLGRHPLPVFALLSVLAFLLQGIKTATGERLVLDAAMLGAGLGAMWLLALASDRGPGR